MTTTKTSQKKNEPSYLHGILLVLLAGLFWSTMGIGIRNIQDANVWQILFYRSIALSLFLYGLIAIRSDLSVWETVKRSGLAGLIGALGLVLAFSGGIYAIQTTTVANAMFLFAAAPFLAAVLGWIMLREKVRKATWIATAFASAGIAVMLLEGFSIGHVVGNLSALGSALGFAVFTVALRWGRLGDMLPAVLLAGIIATLFSLLICSSQNYTLNLSFNDIGTALAMGVFQVGAGLAVYTLGSKAVPAAELALLSMTEVFLGPLWAWLFLSETASGYTLAGGMILLAAISGNALTGLKRKPVVYI